VIQTNRSISLIQQILTAGRVVVVTMAICCLLYGLVILLIGQGLFPFSANGSLLRDEHGIILGSELLAQGFSRPENFWPRPSAVDYNASTAGGSNWSPTNPELRDRGQSIVKRMGAGSGHVLPADLATASGSGLDPHITLMAAKFQAERVATARGLPVETVTDLIKRNALRPGAALTPEPVVNVLLVNLALNRLDKHHD
jgi:K+-transporting ATPase ATPase C chain